MKYSKIIFWTLLLGIAFLTVPNFCFAKDYYLSPTGSDSGSGDINSPWFSLDYALSRFANGDINPRVMPGDTLYLRGGVYNVPAMSRHANGSRYIALNTNPGSAITSIKSYPGEWAILDGGKSVEILELYGSMHNVLFENFEIRNAYRVGFDFGEGASDDQLVYNSTFRNLYFHDNNDPVVNNNPAGMQLSGINCIIEYSTFKDNGTPGSSHYNSTNLILFNDYTKYQENYPRTGNIIRYNVFDGSGASIKDKGDMNLTSSTSPNRNNDALGNEIHHNIFKNSIGMAMAVISDFTKLHHNLVINGNGGFRYYTHEMTDATIWYGKVNNNTFVNMSNYAIAVDDQPAIQFGNQYGYTFLNNLTYDCTADSFLFWTGQSSRNYSVTSDYNVWHNNTATVGRRQSDSNASLAKWQSYGYGAHSILGSVLFVDQVNNNYQLASGSVGNNSGQDGADVGAFGASNWYNLAGYKGPQAIVVVPQPIDTVPQPIDTVLQPPSNLRIIN